MQPVLDAQERISAHIQVTPCSNAISDFRAVEQLSEP